MPFKSEEQKKKYRQKYYQKNKEIIKARTKENRKRVKQVVFKVLGNKCVYCGCNDPNAFEINHKNGNGHVDYKRGGNAFIWDIYSGRRTIDDLELTCAICNAWHKIVKLRGIRNGWIITYQPRIFGKGDGIRTH